MSSRCKRLRRNRRAAGNWVEVNTYAGTFIGRARGRGWLELVSYEADPNLPVEQVLQVSRCPDRGETFVKPIEGRYRDRAEAELVERVAAAERRLEGMGSDPSAQVRETPLWLRLEFLQNVIDFELHPPCGCDHQG
jgi:hypothetical protein